MRLQPVLQPHQGKLQGRTNNRAWQTPTTHTMLSFQNCDSGRHHPALLCQADPRLQLLAQTAVWWLELEASLAAAMAVCIPMPSRQPRNRSDVYPPTSSPALLPRSWSNRKAWMDATGSASTWQGKEKDAREAERVGSGRPFIRGHDVLVAASGQHSQQRQPKQGRC
jgi:hypothetical protein